MTALLEEIVALLSENICIDNTVRRNSDTTVRKDSNNTVRRDSDSTVIKWTQNCLKTVDNTASKH